MLRTLLKILILSRSRKLLLLGLLDTIFMEELILYSLKNLDLARNKIVMLNVIFMAEIKIHLHGHQESFFFSCSESINPKEM
jgi:hypothetical protein